MFPLKRLDCLEILADVVEVDHIGLLTNPTFELVAELLEEFDAGTETNAVFKMSNDNSKN